MVFTKDNYKSFFASEKYQQLNPQEREQLLRFTVEQIREEKNLGPIRVQFVHNGEEHGNQVWGPGNRGAMGHSGSGEDLQHYMYLNADALYRKDDSISYSIYNTINHEAEHGVQATRMLDENISNSNAEVAELRVGESYYYAPEGVFYNENSEDVGYNLYASQACEDEARKAGLDATRQLVEENKKAGVTDEAGEDYVFATTAEEAKLKRDNIRALGAHSREEMAKEAIESSGNLSYFQKKGVLKHAREADYENFKEAYGDVYGEKTLKQAFKEDSIAENYFKSENYQEKMAEIRGDTKNVFETIENSTEVEMEADEEFLTQTSQADRASDGKADEEFFEQAVSNDGGQETKNETSMQNKNDPTQAM